MSRWQSVVAGSRFFAGVYREQVRTTYHARVHHDPLARLFRDQGRHDPQPEWRELRNRGPLSRSRIDAWVSADHAVCRELLRGRSFGVHSDDPGQQPSNGVLDLSLLDLNPPDHSRLRRLAAPAFTARRMSGYRTLVDATVDRLLDRTEELERRDGSVDLVRAFAAPVPIAVITALLGLPDEPERFSRLGAEIALALDGVRSPAQARRLLAAERELRSDFDALVGRTDPDEPTLTAALLREEGGRIDPGELAPLVRLLLIAGFETTVNAIGNGVRAFFARPDQWRLLVAEPERVGAAVEEVLRYDPPVRQTARVVLEPTEVAGVALARDDFVVTLLAGANRDPAVYPHPDVFDITRSGPTEHLAFSGGIHYCLGAALARMELQAAFAALARRYPDLAPAGPVRMRRGSTLQGPRSLPVRFGLS